MITIVEHQHYGYVSRTKHNADQGVTVAYAIDHTTAGERLTQSCAKGKIVKISPDQWYAQPVKHLDKIIEMMERHNTRILNIAGNGIYTWERRGYDQKNVNKEVFDIIRLVHDISPIKLIVSGGQSGTDLAGLIAAAQLDIPCIGTWPRGYTMRFADGRDVSMTPTKIMELMESYA